MIGVWPLIVHNTSLRRWPLFVASALLLFAFVRPALLKPIYILWNTLAESMAWLNTKILLSVIFFTLFTPLGIVRRKFGQDPLNRQFDPHASTYRAIRPARPTSHLTRQF